MRPSTKAEPKREMAERFSRALLKRLKTIYWRNEAAYFGKHPRARRPCGSCAVRMSGREKGLATTMLGFIRSLRGESIFVCHKQKGRGADGNYVPHQKPMFCSGYMVLCGRPDVEWAMHEAAIDAYSGPP